MSEAMEDEMVLDEVEVEVPAPASQKRKLGRLHRMTVSKRAEPTGIDELPHKEPRGPDVEAPGDQSQQRADAASPTVAAADLGGAPPPAALSEPGDAAAREPIVGAERVEPAEEPAAAAPGAGDGAADAGEEQLQAYIEKRAAEIAAGADDVPEPEEEDDDEDDGEEEGRGGGGGGGSKQYWDEEDEYADVILHTGGKKKKKSKSKKGGGRPRGSDGGSGGGSDEDDDEEGVVGSGSGSGEEDEEEEDGSAGSGGPGTLGLLALDADAAAHDTQRILRGKCWGLVWFCLLCLVRGAWLCCARSILSSPLPHRHQTQTNK